MVHSRLSYLVEVWGSARNVVLNPIRVLQNRALKYVCNVPRRYPTNELFSRSDLRVLNIDNLYRFKVAKYVHSSMKGLSYSTKIFRSAEHNYLTRTRGRLRRPKCKNNYGTTSLSFAGPSIYDSLPKEILEIATSHGFSNRLKAWLIESQNH